MCIGAWSLLGYVKTADIKKDVNVPEDDSEECDDDVAEGWDAIIF